MGNLFGTGYESEKTDQRGLLDEERSEASTSGAATGAAAGAGTGAAWTGFALGTVLFIAFIFSIAALVGSIMLWSQWSKIESLETECNVQKVDQFSNTRQFPDVTDLGWNSWSRDRRSSRFNPHISAGTAQIVSARGACAGGLTDFNISTDVGISTTISISHDLGLFFAVSWGNQDGTNGRIFAYDSDCVVVWNKTITELAEEVGVGGTDGSVGVTNPYAVSRTTPTIVTNRTGGINLIFADLGTTALYNNSLCTVNVSDLCGARVYSVEAATGQLLWRTLVRETSPISGYNHQSDIITSSPTISGDNAYFGMSSSQSGSVTSTGILSFYGRYFSIDINTGAITDIQRTTSDAQIDAGNYGSSVWESAPPIDIKGQRIFFGTSNNYNYSASVLACLQAGNSRRFCMEEGIVDDTVFGVSMIDFQRQWTQSPYGVDAWNTGCLGVDPLSVCPDEHGPDYDFGVGCNVIENECGQRFVVCLQKSGVLYSFDADTGVIQWKKYVGTGSYLIPCWGTAFDGKNIYMSIGNTNNMNYLLKDGTLRCDGFWAAVNAWTGELEWTTAVPCSRSSAECLALHGGVAITPDPFLEGIIEPQYLNYSDRYPIKMAPAANCYTGDDIRNNATAGSASATGGVIVTNKLMFAGDFTGHMNVFSKSNGHIIRVLDRCDEGIIYGSASIGVMPDGEQILTWGCGYGRVNFGFPLSAAGNQIKMMTIPSN
jgi:hypothetical protein